MRKIIILLFLSLMINRSLFAMEKEPWIFVSPLSTVAREKRDKPSLLLPEIKDTSTIDLSAVHVDKKKKKNEKESVLKKKSIEFLNTHIRKLTNSRLCDQCGQSFKASSDRAQHISKQHPYKCKCGNFFSYESVLAIHKVNCVYSNKKIVKK